MNATRDYINRSSIDDTLFSLLRLISTQLEPRDCYVVGGFVRDVLLGREISDIDIAVKANVEDCGSSLAQHFHGKFILLDEENEICRIILPDHDFPYIDLSAFYGEIRGDLSRRDFTIDAMAVSLKELVTAESSQIIDPFNGVSDLDHSIIRAVNKTIFSDDPLRLLRAVRLAAELGFTIEHQMELLLKEESSLLSRVAGERIREELVRLINVSRGSQHLEYLGNLGLLEIIVPELNITRDVEQPPEHHWDVFNHSLYTVDAVDFVLKQSRWNYVDTEISDVIPWSKEYANYFEEKISAGSDRRTLLKIAALLHDVGKPNTKAPDKKGRTRFIGHQDLGKDIAMTILERNRFSSRETKMVANMVQYHMRPTQIGYPPSKRAVYRYFRDTGETGVDTLYLSLADHLATRGPGLIIDNWRVHCENTRYILEEYNQQDSNVRPSWLIDGNDLINIFNMKPGPRLGKTLEKLHEMQAAGELTTREQALEYTKSIVLTGRKD